jgi:hypothetical protein
MVERKLPTLTTIERAVYVDGICWSFINTTNMNGFTYNFGNGVLVGDLRYSRHLVQILLISLLHTMLCGQEH